MITPTSTLLPLGRALLPRLGATVPLATSTVNPVTPTLIPHALDSSRFSHSTITGLTFRFGPYRGLITDARASAHRACFNLGSASKMVANKIDGTAIATKIKEQLSAVVTKSKAAKPTFNPSLTIVQGLQWKDLINAYFEA